MKRSAMDDFDRLRQTEAAFWPATLAALILHAILWISWQLMPDVETVVVPVRALSIRLGESEDLAPSVPAAAGESRSQATTEHPLAEMAPAAQATPPSAEKNSVAAPKVMQPQDDEKTAKRYVRKAPSKAQGSVYGDSTADEAELLSRYEQMISGAIHRYRVYPAEARRTNLQGDGVVRVRINRKGKILYYAIEHSTGSDLLDQAMLAMVRQANPVPPVPIGYPAGTLVEFLIPVSFALQR